MRRITCPVCGELRPGVRVCSVCWHRLTAEFGGREWLEAEWFRYLEREAWRTRKADVAQDKIAERIYKLAGEAERRSKFDLAVSHLQAGRGIEEVRDLLAGPTPTRGQRGKATEAVRRALLFLGETYRPTADWADEDGAVEEEEMRYTEL